MPAVDCHLVKRALTGNEDECGDTGFVRESEGEYFIALVDVLGHGKEAHRHALLAEQYLVQNRQGDLVDVLKGLHTHLKGTRGAVAALCRLETATGHLKYVGMGNISVRILGPNPSRLVPRDGIVGYSMSTPKEATMRLSDGDVLVLYSDGLKEHFDLSECPGVLTGNAAEIATELLERFSKGDDDASCIVVRYTR
jgi:serine phosphatase RsbU (regulator of sigma subunit)